MSASTPRILWLALAIPWSCTSPAGQPVEAPVDAREPAPRQVHTASIVARDPVSGELGVAVLSHSLASGAQVSWAEAGVGVLAIQSLVDGATGPRGLHELRAGLGAEAVLSRLLREDPSRSHRQIAVLDAAGGVAAHTGDRCIRRAEHQLDLEGGFSVQVNRMEKEGAAAAMAEAYRRSRGDLAERLLAALEAARAGGADLRGERSAALKIVAGGPAEHPGPGAVFDLRIDDHPRPLQELRRLLSLQRADHHRAAGDAALAAGDATKAVEEYERALDLAPELPELLFWTAVALVSSDRLPEALPLFAEVFEKEPHWRELVPRLAGPGPLPDDPRVQARIQSATRE